MEIVFREDMKHDALPGVILISHGLFAKGLLSSAEMIVGPQQNVAALCYEEADSIDDYREALADTLNKMPKGTVILVDLISGTPFNQMMLLKLKEKMDVNAITGINLPIFIETLFNRNELGGSELLDEVMKTAGGSIEKI